MYALNGATGSGALVVRKRWLMPVRCGDLERHGGIWGSGYSNFGFGTPNNKVYVFGL